MCMCMWFSYFTAYTYNILNKNHIENIYVFESNYILNIVVAMLKYTIMEQVSTNVVINGESH